MDLRVNPTLVSRLFDFEQTSARLVDFVQAHNFTPYFYLEYIFHTPNQIMMYVMYHFIKDGR